MPTRSGLGVSLEPKAWTDLATKTFAQWYIPDHRVHFHSALFEPPMNPESFGSCRILEAIASGPITEVYLGEQMPLGRRVAVKAIKTSISPASPFAFSLAREAQLLGSLRHDNIPRLLEFERTEDAMWMVMDLWDGFCLREVLDKGGQISVAATAAIAIHLVHALVYIHSKGIIHCDVRPENILIGRGGEVALIDFGSAQTPDLPSSPEPIDTQSALGPPEYMSPEQILGEPLDPRSDIFSLGIVLYEMLSGRQPFSHSDERVVAHRVRHDEAPSLDSEIHVPRALASAVSSCLRKLPADRFGSALELSAALEEAYSSVTSSSRQQSIRSALVQAQLIDKASTLDHETVDPISPKHPRISILHSVRMIGVMFGLILTGSALIHYTFHTDQDTSSSVGPGVLELMPSQPGYLRVLAHPWAHVVVDGQQVETTPFAKPISLSAGVHHVTLRHPAATDEKRIVRLASGEHVVLDVTMNVQSVARPDASVSPAPSASTP